MKTKKGQDLPTNVIIVADLALMVLVFLVFLFTKGEEIKKLQIESVEDGNHTPQPELEVIRIYVGNSSDYYEPLSNEELTIFNGNFTGGKDNETICETHEVFIITENNCVLGKTFCGAK